MRTCSICTEVIPATSTDHVVSGKLIYYSNYNKEIGNPNTRRKFLYCSSCTTEYEKWLKKMKQNNPLIIKK